MAAVDHEQVSQSFTWAKGETKGVGSGMGRNASTGQARTRATQWHADGAFCRAITYIES
jgi:hypothetical protein